MEKYFLTSDGVKLHYEVHGSGPLLIFLHGNSQTGRIFKKQVREFQTDFTCLTLDTRAHGKSVFHGERLTFERLALDVAEVMTAENSKTAKILGFSDGANIAMVLASHKPERVDQLILNAGNLTHRGLYSFMRIIPQFLNKIAGFIGLNKPIMRLLLMDTGLNLQDLHKITAKTLVVNGQFDVVKTSHARDIATSIPQARLEIIPLGTHHFFYWQPKKFNQMIRNFLKSC
jgi:pimeloyl-ACP methyl ester carboxylesterase